MNAALRGFAVEALEIRKSFAGVPALRGCNLRVRRGDIHALLGQNGAGKSTLTKILNGVHPRSTFEGEIRINGQPVFFESPAQARANGVGYVPQEIEVLENLSIAENVFAGQMQGAAENRANHRLVHWATLRQATRQLLNELGLSFDASAKVSSLSVAQRQLVMIARAVALRPSVLILDEPTASLSEVEMERLFILLRGLKVRGATLIYITHRLPEILTLCDRASVLRDGVIAAELDRSQFAIDTLVTAMSGGRAVTQRLGRRGSRSTSVVPAKPPLLQVETLTVALGRRPRVRNVSFRLQRGEILGIAGLLGAGRTELLSALYGYLPHSGRILIEGRAVSLRSPRDARAAGVALLTEDRKRDGMLFNLPVLGNVTIGHLNLFAHAGLIQSRVERAAVLSKLGGLQLKCPSLHSSVAYLSGGNQQKLLFARVLLGHLKLLLLDEPTKGVDVATRQEIYRLITALADEGLGVIIVSSEHEELLALSDRCLVMADGTFADEFVRGEGDEGRILRAVAAAASKRAAN